MLEVSLSGSLRDAADGAASIQVEAASIQSFGSK